MVGHLRPSFLQQFKSLSNTFDPREFYLKCFFWGGKLQNPRGFNFFFKISS